MSTYAKASCSGQLASMDPASATVCGNHAALGRGDQVTIGEDRPDGEYPVGHPQDDPNESLGMGWVEFQVKVVAGD